MTNWKEIQVYYDSGKSWRDITHKFHIYPHTLNKAVKDGVFKTRNNKEGNALRIKEKRTPDKICPRCFVKHRGEGNCCSRSCGSKRKRTPEEKQKISFALKGRIGHSTKKADPTKKEIRNCVKCSKEFTCYKISKKINCSLKCGKKNSGGYREGSGNGKCGWYKGIFCNSSYELVWVIFRLDHDLPVQRFQGFLTDGQLKYYPDFILPNNKIIEIKGYYRKEVDQKTNLARSKGYKIDVLYKKDLKECFEWVFKKYHTKNIISLYDGRKPKYEYVCHMCGLLIKREKKLKGNHAYCSKRCAGLGVCRKKKTLW